MIIVGVNFGHDAAVAIIRNGKVLAAIEEEKVSRMSPIEQDSGTKMNRSIDLLKKLNHYLDR